MMTTRPTIIDVRNIPPAQRHPLIFETFDALLADESFELVNDHEPRPLYYTFVHERAGIFHWEYLQSGPHVWRVRIKKVSNNHQTQTEAIDHPQQ